MALGNLFDDATPPAGGERADALLRLRGLVIERIVSADGTATEAFLQAQDEWVVLLRGSATLDVEGRPRDLVAGDHVFLPAGTPHRVLSTAGDALWLAVHLHPDGS